MNKVDLHCHSTASDGLLSPSDVVVRAHEQGVRLLSLTDHDTLAGLAEAHQAAAGLEGLQLVNGVELSARWRGLTLHVLGYGFVDEVPELQAMLMQVQGGRWQRAEVIDKRLAAKGMPGALEGAQQIQREVGRADNAPARPHFAEFLVRQGHVRNRSEAFRRWLGAGKLGDVGQHWPDLESTVGLLRRVGAWVSLAHPCHYSLTRAKRRQLLQAFTAAGGQAVEVVNGMQPAEQVGQLAILCREFGLLASAGSDFHGPGPWSELGLYRSLPEDLSLLATIFAHNNPSSTTTQGAA